VTVAPSLGGDKDGTNRRRCAPGEPPGGLGTTHIAARDTPLLDGHGPLFDSAFDNYTPSRIRPLGEARHNNP
jgi:hypothetical protein